MGWRTLAGSAAAHAVAFSLLFLLYPTSRPMAVPSSIRVNLVNLPTGRVVPRVASNEPESKPRPDLEPERTPNRPRDQAVKLPKPAKENPKPKPGEATTGPAAVGAPGLSAEVGVDDPNFEFTYYLISLRNRIGQNWSAPAGLVTSGKPVRAVVYFRIARDGSLAEPKLEEASGIAFFDQSAMRAVIVSNPVVPLPLGYGGSTLGVHFVFEYAGP